MFSFPCFHSQTIQNNLERSEFETKTRLGSQIQTLEREVAVYKERLSCEEERKTKMADAYEMQVYSTCCKEHRATGHIHTVCT